MISSSRLIAVRHAPHTHTHTRLHSVSHALQKRARKSPCEFEAKLIKPDMSEGNCGITRVKCLLNKTQMRRRLTSRRAVATTAKEREVAQQDTLYSLKFSFCCVVYYNSSLSLVWSTRSQVHEVQIPHQLLDVFVKYLLLRYVAV